MNLDSLFSLLDSMPCGAYAVSLDQKILYWNRSAQRILSFQSNEVVGRHCYEVIQGTAPDSLTPECSRGCPSIRYVRAGLVPPTIRLRMRTSSGDHKWGSVTPMVISGILKDSPLLVHFFDDGEESERFERVKDSARDALAAEGVDILSDHPPQLPSNPEKSVLSRRELQVLRLVTLGKETPRIASELGISRHTVRNHIRNLRHKLGAATKLDAVVKGIRMGILSTGSPIQ